MGKIVCATRGGAYSQRTQQAAIDLARDSGDALVFVYVADASFLDRLAAAVVVDVDAELEQMGWFQLTLAQEQAAEQGIDAQVALRHGRLREELPRAALSLGATTIVLGRPQAETGVFEEANLEAFAAELRHATRAEIILV
jgi:nucleotide-binding universal stress UspA family protein